MAFAKIADLSGEIELVIFPKIYTSGEYVRDNIVIAKGRINARDNRSGAALDELKVIASKITIITSEEARSYKPGSKKVAAPGVREIPQNEALQRLYIRIEDGDDQGQLMTLKQKLDDHKGGTQVVIVTGPSENKQIIKLPQMVSLNETSMRDLASVFGSTNVVVR
jgi:DNA polymerase III alpha subunit